MLSNNAREALEVALGSKSSPGNVADEIAAAIDSNGSGPAADVAAVSPGTVAPITVTTSGGNTYSDAALNTALASAVADIQANRTAINAILSALKAAGMMS